jgi:hypothetical protein
MGSPQVGGEPLWQAARQPPDIRYGSVYGRKFWQQAAPGNVSTRAKVYPCRSNQQTLGSEALGRSITLGDCGSRLLPTDRPAIW